MKRIIPRHKYNSVRTEVNGVKFASKREARYYQDLLLRQNPGGDTLFFLRQVPFHLPGGIIYRVDFQEFHRDGTVHFVDTKGFRTSEYKMKKKLVEANYPIKIEEV